jgi:hypothetical protein
MLHLTHINRGMIAMKEFIESLLNYLRTAKVSSELEDAVELVGTRQLRLISINIVDWLKLENKRDKSKPLKLNNSYAWVKDLQTLVNSSGMFKSFFVINENQELLISNSVNSSERKEIFRLADEGYNPPRMT